MTPIANPCFDSQKLPTHSGGLTNQGPNVSIWRFSILLKVATTTRTPPRFCLQKSLNQERSLLSPVPYSLSYHPPNSLLTLNVLFTFFFLRCVCRDGYEGDGHSCSPVNLCLKSNKGGCDKNVRLTLCAFVPM